MAEVTNYIDRLVAELCPDGVEYRPLGEVAKIKNGKGYKDFLPGNIPVYGSGGVMTYVDTFAYDKPTVLIPRKGSLGNLFYLEEPFWNVDTIFYTEIDESCVIPKYLFYVLRSAELEKLNTAGGVPSLTQKVLNKVLIPVPPLEIQEAIVEILDKFTNLEAELEAELEARTLQYEYYRDSLFEALDCPRVPLGSLGIRNKGIAITASKMRTLEPGNKDVRIFAAGATFVDTDSSFIPDKGILEGPAIIVKSRGHIGFEYYEGKFTHKNELWSYSLTSDLVEQKFIYYYLLTQTYYLHELARGKSVKLPQLAVKDTDELLVPVPSLEEQQRIVDILDRFDALTTSLSEGLPAELAARRSQYEYYRDQLLSFPRKGENQ
ncbi:restriction endonuclease subunit S [uncultured Rothia sp.]|uniref:restriction endonuclease subunit S n=1 Tax=uncultured Rothia sp. TaxID=316088 RepID=UPI00260CB20F|nr:restriction endonuclease subunit S [uncultured Rothia sp.]